MPSLLSLEEVLPALRLPAPRTWRMGVGISLPSGGGPTVGDLAAGLPATLTVIDATRRYAPCRCWRLLSVLSMSGNLRPPATYLPWRSAFLGAWRRRAGASPGAPAADTVVVLASAALSGPDKRGMVLSVQDSSNNIAILASVLPWLRAAGRGRPPPLGIGLGISAWLTDAGLISPAAGATRRTVAVDGEARHHRHSGPHACPASSRPAITRR